MRMRRLRSERILNMVKETRLHKDDLILPLFFDESLKETAYTGSMPGVPTYPISMCQTVALSVIENGLRAVLVFGIPNVKDPLGKEAYASEGVTQKVIRGMKDSGLFIIADLCLCEYTDHGHCGILKEGKADNDLTLQYYSKIAISLAEAGADMVAPSGMMDHQVKTIRNALDENGYKDVGIMAYSAKYASAFYGPFRDIAHSAPRQGDRSSYQMQPANRREAIREIELDVQEGADIVMIKPAMSYLDIVRDARERFDVPIAAYQVSGEYSMIKAAAERGWIDEEKAMMESLISIKRAGADMIITYFAEEAAKRME